MQEPKPPLPTGLITSATTLHDVFPDTRHFDLLRGAGRPFAVAGRIRGGKLADPIVAVVTRDGKLRTFVPDETAGGFRWREEAAHEIAALKGAVVRRINATAFDEDLGGALAVAVTAVNAADKRVFIAAHRRNSQWVESTYASGLGDATGAGFVPHGKLQLFYACSPRGAGGASLEAYGFEPDPRRQFRCTFDAAMDGDVDRLVRVGEQLVLARLKGRSITFHPLAGDQLQDGVLALRLGQRLPSYFSVNAPGIDASRVMPITDTRGACHGMLVRTKQDELYAATFAGGTRNMTAITVPKGGPARALDVAYALEGQHLNLFVRDAASVIWHARTPLRTDFRDLQWIPTGVQGVEIEAPQVMGARPFVFVEAHGDSIDLVAAGAEGEEWTRTSLAMEEAKPVALKTDVHAISVAAVDAARNRVGGVKLHVTAERPVVAEYEGRLYQLDPHHALRLTANAAGAIRLRVRSTGLETASIRVTAPEIAGPNGTVSVRPQEEALRRLTGAQGFAYDGRQLIDRGVLPSMSDADADQIAAAMKASARVALSPSGAAPRIAEGEQPRASVAVWFEDGELRVTSGAAAREALAGVTVTTASPAGFWSFLRSVWNGAKVFIDVFADAVKLTVQLVNDAVALVTSAVRHIAEGVQALIGKVWQTGADLLEAGRRLLAWIADSIGWSDVVRCKNAARRYTLTSLEELETLLGESLPQTIAAQLAKLKTDTTRLFDQAITKFGEDKFLPPGGKDSPLRKQVDDHGARLLLFQDAVSNDPIVRSPLALSGDQQTKLEAIHAKIVQLAPATNKQLLAALEAVADKFKGGLTLDELVNLGVAGMLAVVKPLVLAAFDLVDALQQLVFELVRLVLRAFRDALTTELRELGGAFQWLDAIYFQLAGERLTLIDAACLLFVAPGVILHHLLGGKDLLPDEPLPVAMPTVLSVGVTLLKPATAGPCPTFIADTMLKAYEKLHPWYEPVMAVWSIARGLLSIAENIWNLAVLRSPPGPNPGYPALIPIFSLIDYAVIALGFADAILPYAAALELKLCDVYVAGGGAVLVALLLPLFFLLLLYVIVPYTNLPAKARIWIGAVLSSLFGHVLQLLNLVYIAYHIAVLAKTDTLNRAARFYLTRAASFLLYLRNFAQLFIPIAAEIMPTGPQGMALGAKLVWAQHGADVGCRAGFGVLHLVRRAMPKT